MSAQRVMQLPVSALFLVLALLPTLNTRGQSLPDLVHDLGIRELARDYLRPGADAIGYSVNSGMYSTARIDSGMRLKIAVRGIWAFVPEKDRAFVAKLPASLTALGYPSSVTTATIFGDKGAVLQSTATDPNGQPYPDITLPGGTGLHSTVLAVPQVTFGSILASEVMVRAIPDITFDPEIGKIHFFGIGVSHSPTQYIRLPFDLAFMAAAQKFRIGDVLTGTTLNANARASIPVAFLTLFAGAGYESYTLDVSYTYTPTDPRLPAELHVPTTVSLDFRRSNYRFTLGATLALPLIEVTADYSFGIQDVFTIGAGLTL